MTAPEFHRSRRMHQVGRPVSNPSFFEETEFGSSCSLLMLSRKASIHEYLGVSWKVDGNVQEYMWEERLDGDHNRPSRVHDLVMNLDVSWKVDENVQEYRREVYFDWGHALVVASLTEALREQWLRFLLWSLREDHAERV